MRLDWTMTQATRETIDALSERGEIDARDSGMARLALETAERIDADGKQAYVSLYERHFNELMALRHVRLVGGMPMQTLPRQEQQG